MWKEWWRGGAFGGFSAGPRGLLCIVSYCSWPLHFGLLVFLQRNPAIKLLCNDVDVVLVYLVDGDVLVCCDVR